LFWLLKYSHYWSGIFNNENSKNKASQKQNEEEFLANLNLVAYIEREFANNFNSDLKLDDVSSPKERILQF